MGFMDGGQDKAYSRQKESLLKQIEHVSGKLIDLQDIGLQSQESALGSTLKALFGGRSRIDHLQLFQINTGGLQHIYVQPYAGINPMPGEHHAIIDSSISESIIFEAGILRKKWKTASDNKELETELKQNKDLKNLTSGLDWEWKIGMSKVELEWTLQLRPLGHNKAHLVMKAATYGFSMTCQVGMSLFLKAAQVLNLKNMAQNTEQAFINEPHYAALFDSLINGTREVPTVASPSPAQSVKEASPKKSDVNVQKIIIDMLIQNPHKKIFVENLPEKKETNIRKHVLPPVLKEEKILAAIDITLMGSAKDAIVFLKDRLVAREIEDPIVFAYTDLLACQGVQGALGDSIKLEIQGIGSLSIPCGEHGVLLKKMFTKITGQA